MFVYSLIPLAWWGRPLGWGGPLQSFWCQAREEGISVGREWLHTRKSVKQVRNDQVRRAGFLTDKEKIRTYPGMLTWNWGNQDLLWSYSTYVWIESNGDLEMQVLVLHACVQSIFCCYHKISETIWYIKKTICTCSSRGQSPAAQPHLGECLSHAGGRAEQEVSICERFSTLQELGTKSPVLTTTNTPTKTASTHGGWWGTTQTSHPISQLCYPEGQFSNMYILGTPLTLCLWKSSNIGVLEGERHWGSVTFLWPFLWGCDTPKAMNYF